MADIIVTCEPVIEIGLRETPRFKRVVQVKIYSDSDEMTTGDDKLIFTIPQEFAGYRLSKAHAYVTTASSSEVINIQLRNYIDDVDILSTAITIDASEYNSYTATTAPVLDTDENLFETGDMISVDIDAKGTGAKGLGVILTFEI